MVKIKDFTLATKNLGGVPHSGAGRCVGTYTPLAHKHLRSHIEQYGNNKCAVVD